MGRSDPKQGRYKTECQSSWLPGIVASFLERPIHCLHRYVRQFLQQIKRGLCRYKGNRATLPGLARSRENEHLRRGRIGELAARRFLKNAGYKILATNFRTPEGEVDLVVRQQECLVFVEVKARSFASWTRPEEAVDRAKMRRLSAVALHYLKRIRNPRVALRFDIVEVLLADGEVAEIRHLRNAFELSKPWDYFGKVG
jgi:putative endonuclease